MKKKNHSNKNHGFKVADQRTVGENETTPTDLLALPVWSQSQLYTGAEYFSHRKMY